jgi:hypothetical protein
MKQNQRAPHFSQGDRSNNTIICIVGGDIFLAKMDRRRVSFVDLGLTPVSLPLHKNFVLKVLDSGHHHFIFNLSLQTS